MIFHELHALALLGLYVYLDIKPYNWEPFSRIARAACRTISSINDMIQEDSKNAGRLPIIMIFGLLSGHTMLLRLLRSELASSLDQDQLTTHMYMAIGAMDQLSARGNRVAQRSALLMSQLSKSKKVFRAGDGVTPDTGLKFRTRLYASPIFDAARWWRDEFEVSPPPKAPYLESAGVAVSATDELNWMLMDFDVPLDMGLMLGGESIQ
jgi:hypothetical protein